MTHIARPVCSGTSTTAPSVTVSVDDDEITLSMDAKLSTLSISPGTLAPTFVSATLEYTATLASDVTRVTATATANNSKAAIAWLAADDSALADADTDTADFQVDLAVGANVVKVQVTPEDDSAPTVYTLTLTTHATVHASGDSLGLGGGHIRSAATGRDALLDHPGASRTGTAGVTPPLTAEFRSLPEVHRGPGHPFTFELHFSHEIKMSYVTVRDDLLSMRARVDRARRLAQGSNLGWEITVTPVGYDDIVMTLPATTDCTSATAVCTGTGQKLEAGISALVQGMPAVRVADAEVEEGPGARLDFLVTLSRAAEHAELVRFHTVDGTAQAGSDYEETRGFVVFEPGVTTRTASVPVHDDRIDEGPETMTPEVGVGLSQAEREVTLGWRLARAAAAGLVFDVGVQGRRRYRFGAEAGPEHELGVGFGWRLAGAGNAPLSFGTRIEATRRERADVDAAPEHGLGLRVTARW